MVEQIFEFNIKAIDVEIPKSLRLVFKNKYKELWLRAADEEILALLRSGTFQLVERKKEMVVHHMLMVFDLKTICENVERFRCRMVVDGSSIIKEVV